MPARTRDASTLWDHAADEAHKLLILREFRKLGQAGASLAARLGIGTSTLYREIDRLGLRGDLGLAGDENRHS